LKTEDGRPKTEVRDPLKLKLKRENFRLLSSDFGQFPSKLLALRYRFCQFLI